MGATQPAGRRSKALALALLLIGLAPWRVAWATEYWIQGWVRDPNYVPYGAVAVKTDDGYESFPTFCGNGSYGLLVPEGWTGTVRATGRTSSCYSFAPFAVTQPVTDDIFHDFTGTVSSYTVSGTVYLASQPSTTYPGIDLELQGSGDFVGCTYQATSGANGTFSFPGVQCDYTGQLISLDPCHRGSVNLGPVNNNTTTNLPVTLPGPYIISGTVTDDAGGAVSNFTLAVSPTPLSTSIGTGTYSVTVACGWNGTIQPAHPDFQPFEIWSSNGPVYGSRTKNFVGTRSVLPRITAPMGGETWRIGNAETIRWVYDGVAPDAGTVHVFVGDGATIWSELWPGVDGDFGADGSSFTWTVDPAFTYVSHFKVQASRQGHVESDISDGPITRAGGFYRETDRARVQSTPYTLPWTGVLGLGATWVELDFDATPELIMTTPAGPKVYSRATAGGVYTDVTCVHHLCGYSGNAQGVSLADFNNDGVVDLLVTGCTAPGEPSATKLYRGSVNSIGFPVVYTYIEFLYATTFPAGCAHSAAWGDYDGDGNVDVYLTYGAGEPNRLFRNQGPPSYGFVQAAISGVEITDESTSAVWGDYDNDGDLDLYVTTRNAPDRLFQNISSISPVGFAGISGIGLNDAPNQSNSAAWGDYDGDGDLDLYVTHNRPLWGQIYINSLYRNDGGHFSLQYTQAPGHSDFESTAANFVDYDGDGFLDLFVSTLSQRDMLYKGNGTSFTEVVDFQPFTENADGYGIAWADNDGDRDPDLFMVRRAAGVDPPVGTSDAVENYVGNGARWLRLKLVTHSSNVSNRDAIGARIKVVQGSSTQCRQVNGGGGYFSQSAADLLFGIPSPGSLSLIEVRWPSGRITSLQSVAFSGVITVNEPSTPPPPPPGGCRGCPPPQEGKAQPQQPVPTVTRLVGLQPNPFNPKTTIRFDLATEAQPTLTVYDTAGRRVVSAELGHRPAGAYAWTWDGRDANGGAAASGVYYFEFRAGQVVQTQRGVLLK